MKKLKFVDERLEGKSCQNTDCHYWDESYESNCSGETETGPNVMNCGGYIPGVKNKEVGCFESEREEIKYQCPIHHECILPVIECPHRLEHEATPDCKPVGIISCPNCEPVKEKN